MRVITPLAGLLSLACLLAAAAPAQAQQGPGWFVPPAGQQRPAGAPAPRPQPPRTAPPAVLPAPSAVVPDLTEPPQSQVEIQLPPAPDLQPLPKGTPPPPAVIGVLGVPEVMRASTAAQEVEKVIGARREKLNEDAQKEQGVWRELQQGLANERAKLTPDQIRARERDLQERITNAQKQFRDRNRIIQEAAQVSLAQIERTLVAVIRQVADSRGMNLVLHRAQVALNVAEFDLTQPVADQLNKVLASVVIPPDGVSPSQSMRAPDGPAAPTATPASAPQANAPASAPRPN